MSRATLVHVLLLTHAAAALFTLLPDAGAQTCSAGVTGSIYRADGSAAPPGELACGGFRVLPGDPNGSCVSPYCLQCDPHDGGWESVTVYPPGTGDYDFMGSSANYFATPWNYGLSHCNSDPTTGCLTCDGSFSIGLYARSGSFNGTVYRLPEGRPEPNAFVMADPNFIHHTSADDAGHYDFAG